MKFVLNITFLLVLFVPFQSVSQVNSSSVKSAQRFYESAGTFISNRQFDKAVGELEKAVQADPAFAAAYQQMGDLYRRMNDFEKALPAYRKVLEINPKFHNLTYYGLAESEFNTGDYESALSRFNQYLQMPGINPESRKKAEKYIRDASFSIVSIKNPVSFSPENLGSGINSAEDEYLPVITADEERIIFTRLASNQEDFYLSKKEGSKWASAKTLSKNINSPGNEGAQCISPDGNYLFFTACDRPDGLGRCDIYVSKWENSDWSEPFNLGAPINTSGWESQPSISADGRTLYFVSTRSGGQGSYDIWKSELDGKGSWSPPQNLGPGINTPYDEHSPFIHPDDETLYFSSNGWAGFGSKDVFLSKRSNANTGGSEWSIPLNLGYPINTHKEESSLSVSAGGRIALMASQREGGYGKLDIYAFELPQNLKPAPVTYVKGRIFDHMSKEPLEATIRIVDLETGRVIYDDISSIGQGDFLATMKAGRSFAMHINKNGYLFHSSNFKPELANFEKPYLVEIPLVKIEVGNQAVLNNIFFDLNKFELLPQSRAELDVLIDFMQQNPDVSIEIRGHTDNLGDDGFNEELSMKRAKTVYEYLVAGKIAAKRLSYKGYGESKPVAPNSNDEGRAMNRRTEFRITAK